MIFFKSLKLLDSARQRAFEVLTLFRAWVSEYFTDEQIIRIFREKPKSEFAHKALKYVSTITQAELTESQALVLLELFHDYVSRHFSDKEILQFFRSRGKKSQIGDRKVQWSYHFKRCLGCGMMGIPHKAHGLCQKCYREKRSEKKNTQILNSSL